MGFQIKSGWIQQVYNSDLVCRFPQLKMILWFSITKFEQEVDNIVDWSLTSTAISGFYQDHLRLNDWVIEGPIICPRSSLTSVSLRATTSISTWTSTSVEPVRRIWSCSPVTSSQS